MAKRTTDRPTKHTAPRAAKKAGAKKPAAKKPPAKKSVAKKAEPRLLTGGNPQIAKGYGDEPIRAWIDAAPGWKSAAAARVDALVTKAVPGVKKAVKWNSPLYGVSENRYFLGLHAMTKYLKVAFFEGAQIEPVPPIESKQAKVRYFHIHEGDKIDEKQLVSWIKQASKLPGEKM